jgi:hypothetical protein
MNKEPRQDDQDALNHILRPPKKSSASMEKNFLRKLRMMNIDRMKNWNARAGYLDNRFFTVGVQLGKRWHPGMEISVPENIIMHHANWTVGVENKMALLKHVREIVETRRKGL